ncbi:hypothetical protein RY831_30880 [Noviherbaspirillum sp. CPCC 100848]|uniref:C2H2-type domain-containing protein n=1 Tax=Noviherbaspirillum album TaxID=3080276 RepID=A0ABU6JIM4_9BURK|nr:hypothetical protein [Noviherbaspirillum sp. CPCC 100848]MEC4723548.1 hypothetical protein [Noviherbaspirillum sp. CPCC 100848]
MRKWTEAEVTRGRCELEFHAATLLGQMVFEFSRLDMALGLCLVWVDGGKWLETLTETVMEENFHTRLTRLEKQVLERTPDESEVRTVYLQWITDANRLRAVRNEWIHGRWGVDHIAEKVVNVIGLPTSTQQRSTAYGLAELEATLAQMIELQHVLGRLREKWPLQLHRPAEEEGAIRALKNSADQSRLEKCSQCTALIRPDRLAKHIRKAHAKKSLTTSPFSGIARCTVCNFPAIPGDSVCFTHAR